MGYLEILGRSITDGAFWIAFALVFIFAFGRFSLAEAADDGINPPTLARTFTTRFRYWLGATAYAGFYEFIYFVLLCIGATPLLYELLAKWLGSVKIEGTDYEIGTPMWAALVATSIIPSVKGFKQLDTFVRGVLQEFSSIPWKGQKIAAEIRAEFWQEVGAQEEQGPDFPARFRVLDRIKASIDRLKSVETNPKKAAQYRKFIYDNHQYYETQLTKDKQLRKIVPKDEDERKYLSDEIDALTCRLTRFLSCALLLSEPSEPAIRQRLCKSLGLKNFPMVGFNFQLKQIIIAVFEVSVVTFAMGLGTLWLSVYFYGVPDADMTSKKLILEIIGQSAVWVPYTIVMYIPGFVLAAGVRFYFNDRRMYDNEPVQMSDHFIGACLLFMGAFGMAAIPVLLGISVRSGEAVNAIKSAALFASPPAFAATIFYVLSYFKLIKSKSLAFLADFFVFAVPVGLLLWASTWLALSLEIIKPEQEFPSEFTGDSLMFAFSTSAAVIAGLLGAVQLAISRRPVTQI